MRRISSLLAALVLLLLQVSAGQQSVPATSQPMSGESTSAPSQRALSQQQQNPSSSAVLEDGTPVKVRISRTVSSADARVGETVDFEVLEEIRVNGVLVVPKGGVAWATVTEAQPKRRLARGGKLGMNIDSVRLADGEKAALRAVKEVKGGGHTGAMTGAIVGTAIFFFPAAPLFLFMHGKDITVPKGTEITAYINGKFPLDLARFQEPRSVREGETSSAATAQTTIEISSSPTGAEIELDGAFAGNTPSSIGVSAGEHSLTLSKPGYKPWERTIRTSSGTVRVAPELQQDAQLSAQPGESK